ncbi:uracil-DNA glycosylase [Paenibacillus lignilyticus]|uniref:Uracil-DNA glycosylase n=1 Tax=Paenibacillus lignilyticus TaxID=1172615 RepID=A0ABS5CE99_9BACL|nr:uracil-DNA glycosylase [Paenibacillus lignilyticus]MBP3964298.1 uracil-DNA glycosylase [Paenibacillus lignilyticus]
MTFVLSNDWAEVLSGELEKPYFHDLNRQLAEQYETELVYPDQGAVFNALHYTSYEGTQVVIIGQDPYHGPGQAHGLSFSVLPGVKTPPSLQNIYKEMQTDLGLPIPDHGFLEAWAKQGVLLLNNVLTVKAGLPASHKGLGWERFTDAVIAALNDREQPVVFVLWGKHAQEKAASINQDRHFIISSAHPSPFAARRGFFGSRPFTRANQYLRELGRSEIEWRIPMLAELQGEAN